MLISAETRKHAEEMARERNLKPTEWVYVPWNDGRRRHEILLGRSIKSLDELVGYFSDFEILRLSRIFSENL